MAASTEAPDPRSLKTWEEAFQYPIPTVRAMEKKLRTHTVENHDKLRTLVGASYRDLLGTAQTIIEVNGQIEDVETLLRDAARKADSRQLDKRSRHCAVYTQHVSVQNSRRYAVAAQTATLFAAVDCIATLLRSRKAATVAAKLLVVARLLYKSVAELQEEADETSAPLKRLGKSIALLRGKLLRSIDRRLARADSDVSLLVEDLTAFTLVTSSSPSDALTHFQHLRSEAVRNSRTETNQSLRACILQRLRLLLNTQSQSRSIFPHLLGPSLRTLGAKALLANEVILDLDDLKLDVHKRWFKDEVVNYTPWTRHDDLSGVKAEAEIKSWVHTAFKHLIVAVRDDLSLEDDIHAVAEARKHVLQAWLSSGRSLRGLDTKGCLLALAEAFMDRMKTLAADAAAQLNTDIFNVIGKQMAASSAERTETSIQLWDSSIRTSDISNGAALFRQAIINTRSGRSSDVSAVLEMLEARVQRIEDARESIQAVGDVRWDDDYDDDDEEEDGEGSRVTVMEMLRRVQPQTLAAVLTGSTLGAVQNLEVKLGDNPTPAGESKADARSPPNASLLRLLRALRVRLSTLLMQIDPSTTRKVLFQSQVLQLHTSLAYSIEQDTTEPFSTSLQQQARRHLHIQALWDGTPPLPIQISPATFKYLRAVVKQMDASGADLWTSDLVAILKTLLARKVADVVNEAITDIQSGGSTAHVNGSNRVPAVNGMSSSDRPSIDADASDDVKDDTDTGAGKANLDGAEAHKDEADEIGENIAEEAAGHATVEESTETEKRKLPNGTSTSDVHDAAKVLPQQQDNVSARRDVFIQLLFDALYLQQALSVGTSTKLTHGDLDQPNGREEQSHAELGQVIERLISYAHLGEDENDGGDEMMTRMRKGAEGYWKRTYLLFGLLCG